MQLLGGSPGGLAVLSDFMGDFFLEGDCLPVVGEVVSLLLKLFSLLLVELVQVVGRLKGSLGPLLLLGNQLSFIDLSHSLMVVPLAGDLSLSFSSIPSLGT